MTKPVFGVPDKARLKPVSSATETSWKIEISPIASLHMILFIKRITKALIRLRGCAGWSAPVLFANPRRQVFSRRGPFYLVIVYRIECHVTSALEVVYTNLRDSKAQIFGSALCIILLFTLIMGFLTLINWTSLFPF